MTSKAHIAGHPIHPILVTIPVGLWVFALISDIIFRATDIITWYVTAYYCIAAGVIGALLAAVPGLFDLYGLPHSHAKKIGLWHMAINLCLVTLYVINFLWRRNVDPTVIGPFVLSIFSVILLFVSGWLGGELVFRYGAGVVPVSELAADKPHEHHEGIFGLKLHHRH